MDENIKLLLERIEEAIRIIGSQKKLCELAGVNPVLLSRLKGYHKGTANLPSKREALSIRTLEKLAKAIDEDVTFFTNINYIRKKDRENVIFIDHPEFMEVIGNLKLLWDNASEMEKGGLLLLLKQTIEEYKKIVPKASIPSAA